MFSFTHTKALCHGMGYHTPGEVVFKTKFVLRRMVIITKVFIINENVYHSLILLVWGYLLIYNMQELSHGVYVPFSVRLPSTR